MKDEVLPEFWQSVGLKQIATLYGGGTPARKTPAFFEGAIPWLTGADLSDEEVFSIRESREYITEEAIHKSATNPVPPKTVLITTRVNVGKVAVAEKEVCFSQDLTGIVIKEELQSVINPYYIAYYLLANKARILRYDRGTTISGIQRRDLARFRVWLPPLPEQERIVEILREADELRRQQQAALTTAQTLIPALFHHMFGDPDPKRNNRNWDTVVLGRVFDVGTGGTPRRLTPDFFNGSHFWVKTTELKDEIITQTEETLTDTGLNASNAKIYPQGTILVAMYGQGQTRGRTAKLAVPASTNQACAAFPPIEEIMPNYLWHWFQNSYAAVRSLGRGGPQENLNLTILKNLKIPKPDIEIQKKFSDLVDFYLDIYQSKVLANQGFEELMQSLLIRAFDGELTERFRQNKFALLQAEAEKRDALLGHVRHAVTPVVEEEVNIAGVLKGRDTLAHSLSLPQQTLLQTIVAYLTENGRRYFTLPGFLDDHASLPVNAVRQNVELLEKVGLLTRVSRQVAPEGIPYFETFYRLTTPLVREAAA